LLASVKTVTPIAGTGRNVSTNGTTVIGKRSARTTTSHDALASDYSRSVTYNRETRPA
jgi:hypothetical protein